MSRLEGWIIKYDHRRYNGGYCYVYRIWFFFWKTETLPRQCFLPAGPWSTRWCTSQVTSNQVTGNLQFIFKPSGLKGALCLKYLQNIDFPLPTGCGKKWRRTKLPCPLHGLVGVPPAQCHISHPSQAPSGLEPAGFSEGKHQGRSRDRGEGHPFCSGGRL